MTTPESPPLPTGLCVLGLGLIGGSVLRAAADHLPVAGWSPSEGTRSDAAAAGFNVHQDLVAALEWAVATDALVILASPLDTFDELLRKITRYAPEVLLTDVGSVKSTVTHQVSTIAPRSRYVGGHPMAGTQRSGFGSGSPQLFVGAPWVTCLEAGTHLPAWDVVAGLALAVGARVVPCTVADHDHAVARISHLPHLLALALAQVGEMGGALALSLAAGAFADGSRVAATRAELIRAMCESNRDPLIDAFDDALGILGVARGSLASTGSLDKLTQAGHTARLSFEHHADDLSAVELVDPAVTDLVQLGEAGGFVSAVRRTSSGRTVSGSAPADWRRFGSRPTDETD
ncbi:MAG: prephenate dehydrogenase [Actinomycetota bacterium]|nr:prephenate dehydrogenase [Actinomycetota bacterium]